MKRRLFLKESTTLVTGLGLSSVSCNTSLENNLENSFDVSVTVNEERVSIFSNAIKSPVKIVHIADTHLFMDDKRGYKYKEFSDRMAGAYNQTSHFKTRKKTSPRESFEKTLMHAKEEEADLIALVGDIFSFPSELAIEWVISKLKEIDIPYVYVSGNHDWHYEGMEGSMDSLRNTWINKRLLPLYQNNDPLMAAYDIKGIRFLAVDNSTYEINEDQLEFFSNQVETGLPLVLLVHIPMYAPGKSISYGCGNPNWSAKTDRNYNLERRPRWPNEGHTKTTFEFHKKVFEAPNLLGIFTGHIHKNTIEIVKGKPQIVSDDNASGGFLNISFLPNEMNQKES